MPLSDQPLGTPGPPHENILWEIRGMLQVILHEQRRFNERMDRLDTRQNEVSDRMSRTENKMSWMVGIGAAAVFVIGFLKETLLGVFH